MYVCIFVNKFIIILFVFALIMYASYLEDMCMRELERRYQEKSIKESNTLLDEASEKEQTNDTVQNVGEDIQRDTIMGLLSLNFDSSDDDDDVYEDDTWMSVASESHTESGRDETGMDIINICGVDAEEEGSDVENEHLQDDVMVNNEEEEEEEEDDEIYRELLPQREDHVLCNFAISCIYKGNITDSSSHSTLPNDERGNSLGAGHDHLKALNSLKKVIDLQVQTQPSYI